MKARDAAGNTSSKDGYVFKWNVVPLKPVTIDLAPGWNLISFPVSLRNPAINAVIPSDHPADVVMTYDNEARGWKVSRRHGETGLFTGDIEKIIVTKAYYIRTDTSQGISHHRPFPYCTSCYLPPQRVHEAQEGWDLVPVMTDLIPFPETIPADVYFGTLDDDGWLKASTFDTSAQVWESVFPGETVPDGDDEDTEPDMATLTVGKGYWLYATRDGVIIP